MEATVLLCNWCQAKGKPVFATVHINVGVAGPRGKHYALDACPPHAMAFQRGLLVGTTISGKTPKQIAKPMIPRGSVTIDDVRRPMLKYLAKAKEPIKAPTLFGSHLPGGLFVQKKTVRALRTEGLVEMRGLRNSAHYTLTAKGRARVKKKGAPTAKVSAPEPQRAARRLRRKR